MEPEHQFRSTSLAWEKSIFSSQTKKEYKEGKVAVHLQKRIIFTFKFDCVELWFWQIILQPQMKRLAILSILMWWNIFEIRMITNYIVLVYWL